MRLIEVKIENFRSINDETIRFDGYTCLVGPNGGGKSTILMALNVFFRNAVPNIDLLSLTQDDFHHRDTSRPIRITLTFDDLSPEAQKDFQEYYRQGKLIVSAVAEWDGSKQIAPVLQYGSRFVMADFSVFFGKHEADEKVGPLKDLYNQIRAKYPDLPSPGGKEAMRESLRAYEEAHPELCELKESTQQFYGFTKGANRLPKYVQWIYIPAVKDAASEQDEDKKTALGQLLQRTIRGKINFKDELDGLKKDTREKYDAIVQKQEEALGELSDSLNKRFQAWSHPGATVSLKWHCDEDKSLVIEEPFARALLGEHGFSGEIARLGHGLQRSFLVVLLQELSLFANTDSPTLLLGFEEPELYQHPPQARYLAGLLEKLPAHNIQVIASTHNPYFIPANSVEGVRMVRKTSEKSSKATQLKLPDLEQALSKALGKPPRSPSTLLASVEQIMNPSLKELFFSHTCVLVEGPVDVAFISTYLHLTERWFDFRKHGCHFVISGGKTNLSRPLAIANGFGVPTFSVFDADTDCTDKNEVVRHTKDNKCLLSLCGVEGIDPMPKEIIWQDNLVVWPKNFEEAVKQDFGEAGWDAAVSAVRKENGWEGVSAKNHLLIAGTVEKLWGQGKRSVILNQLCESIISFSGKYAL